MKRGIVFLALILMVFSTLSFGKKLATLPGLLRPNFIVLDDQNIYICHGAEVRIYSRKDFSLKGSFGKAGSGPQEFQGGPGGGVALFVSPQKENLLVSSIGKASIYSKEGKYISETRIPAGGMMIGLFQALGDKFVGMGLAPGEDESIAFTLNLFDSGFKKIKEIRKQDFMKKKSFTFPTVNPTFFVSNDKIVTVAGKDFVLNILDGEGNIVTTITRDYDRLSVTDSYKNDVLGYFKEVAKDRFEFVKSMLKFSDKFPAIQNFVVNDGKIYIQTFVKEDDKYEFFIYDLDGKFLKRLFIHVNYPNILSPSPYTIKDDTLFQLVENEDEEEWELHAQEIK